MPVGKLGVFRKEGRSGQSPQERRKEEEKRLERPLVQACLEEEEEEEDWSRSVGQDGVLESKSQREREKKEKHRTE